MMTRRAILLFLSSLLLPSVVHADVLDKVTGTERWRSGASADPRVEWRDWLRARSTWRAALRSLHIEAARNRQIALLRRKRERVKALPKTAPPKSLRRVTPAAKPKHQIRIYRGTADEDDEDDDGEDDEDDEEGSKVPLERLHNTR